MCIHHRSIIRKVLANKNRDAIIIMIYINSLLSWHGLPLLRSREYQCMKRVIVGPLYSIESRVLGTVGESFHDSIISP